MEYYVNSFMCGLLQKLNIWEILFKKSIEMFCLVRRREKQIKRVIIFVVNSLLWGGKTTPHMHTHHALTSLSDPPLQEVHTLADQADLGMRDNLGESLH